MQVQKGNDMNYYGLGGRNNPYYNPEEHGLRIVGAVEFSSGAYEFDTFVVWQDMEDGKLLYAADSGCSCPIPFQDVAFVEATWAEIDAALIERIDDIADRGWHYGPAVDHLTAARGELVQKCRQAVR